MASANAPFPPDFWQLFLTAELPFVRRESLLQRAGRLPQATDWRHFFEQAPELSPADRERVRKSNPNLAASALAAGARLHERPQFPERIGHLMGAPSALFSRGDFTCLQGRTVGIVGTRGASTYGRAAAQKFAEAIARAGVIVVSGGAPGIDAAAHEGALLAQGQTAAVLACGIDRLYPASQKPLYARIERSGCLVSQFPAGWNPRNDSFLQRNATIAALSEAILVVEAPELSGALSTANRANEFGRPIYVVPGNISSPSFRGSHALIRDGATLVDHPDQILEELGVAARGKSNGSTAATSVQVRILQALKADCLPADKIAEDCGLEAPQVLSELTLLELEGKVLRGPGGYALAP